MSSNHLALATTCRRSGGVETDKVFRVNIKEMLLSRHLLCIEEDRRNCLGGSQGRKDKGRKDRRVVLDCRLLLAPDFARAGAGGCRNERSHGYRLAD